MGQLVFFARSPTGIFAFSPGGELLYYKLFSRSPEKAVSEFLASSEKDVKDNVGHEAELVEGPGGYKILRKNIREYAKSLGFAENDAELNQFLSSFALILSRKRLAGLISKDKLLVQAVNAHDDLHRAVNAFEERVYEWFSLHYPEVGNARGIVGKILSYGRRENFPNFRTSFGVELNEADEKALAEFASAIKELGEEKNRLEDYVRKTAKELAPNTSSLVDEILAARLIALAGSLEKLVKLPASSLQLLGAEKALFRHLHKKGKSPKYGIIYTSPYIQNAQPDRKGKAARILASKLMMAARIDYYSGRHDENIKKQLDEEIARLKQ